MVAYGPFPMAPRPAWEGLYGRIRSLPYGAVAGLWRLLWSHMAPYSMVPRPACEGSYGRIVLFPLWHSASWLFVRR